MGYSFEYVHSDNSAATLTRKDDLTNMIRPGIILYGYLPSPDLKADISLTPVLSLKSVVSMVKNIKKGDSVSYGRIFTAEHDMKIATVPVGYADGYPRYLSDKGYALISGKRVRIIGRICMDQMMLDVSELDNVKIGDVVTLIGKDTGEKITAEDIAELGNTISYEIICGFTPRVERKYL
jgi:alanine racemase